MFTLTFVFINTHDPVSLCFIMFYSVIYSVFTLTFVFTNTHGFRYITTRSNSDENHLIMGGIAKPHRLCATIHGHRDECAASPPPPETPDMPEMPLDDEYVVPLPFVDSDVIVNSAFCGALSLLLCECSTSNQ
jgi:hypothetical protein